MSELVELTAAQRALAEVETPAEAKELYDKLEALSQYAKRYRLDHEKQNEIAEAKLRTARKGGALLAASGFTTRPVRQLPDGFSKAMSSRWQTIAKLSDEHFEQLLGEYEEITFQALLDWAKRRERQEVDDNARTIRPASGPAVSGKRWTMYPRPFEEALLQFEDECADIIVTDPPYPSNDLGKWSLLGELAGHVLVEDGLLCALSGQIELPNVIVSLCDTGLHYGWMYCQPLPGSSSRILARQIGQTWKPWLVFSRTAWPSGRIDWHPDMLDGVPLQKTHYRWQQSTGPAAQLIHFLSPRNGVVLDPFAGTGSYGVAALEMGRRFVGIEADADRFERACIRLRAVEQ